MPRYAKKGITKEDLERRIEDAGGMGEVLCLPKIQSDLKKIEKAWSRRHSMNKKAVVVARLKVEHPEWYSATGSLGLRDFQIDAFGVKDAEMESHFVQNMNSETINRLDDQNRRDMRNWSDSDEDGE